MAFETEIIEDENDFEVISEGPFTKCINNYFRKKNFPEESIEEINNNSLSIVGQCPNPISKGEINKTGIIIGKVQSGKTSNFISLIASAFDNNYDIAILFGGTKNSLVEQNEKRCEEAFKGICNKVNVVSVKEKDIVNGETLRQLKNSGKKIVITSIKLPVRIDKLFGAMRDAGFSNESILIIDDEADQASPNTKVKSGDESATYKSLMDFRNSFKKSCLVSVTATPYANILINTYDELSPDFGQLIYPGRGYVGSNNFFGISENDEIPDQIQIIDKFYDEYKMDPSLKKAIDYFLDSRDSFEESPRTMLVHTSQRKKDHENLNDQINRYLEQKGAKDTRSFVLNSRSNKLQTSNFDNTIYVAGELAGRGITFPNLLVTFITRMAKQTNADTVEQRARWFGYRQNIFPFMRIYMTKEIYDGFCTITEFENDLWDAIETAEKEGIEFKEIERMFKLSDIAISPTRTSILENFERFNYGEWIRQNYFLLDEEKNKGNIEILNRFRSNHEVSRFRPEISQKREIIENLTYEDLMNQIFEHWVFPSSSNLSKQTLKTLYSRLKGIGKEKFSTSIIFLDRRTENHKDYFAIRSIRGNGEINNLFQGYNPTGKENYPGDSEIRNGEDIVLQVHFVKPKHESKKESEPAPVLALHLPLVLRKELGEYIGYSNKQN